MGFDMERRRFLQAVSGAAALAGCSQSEPVGESAAELAEAPSLGIGQVCFITDEYSQDLDEAIAFAKEFGVTQVEIRAIDGKYFFLEEAEKIKAVQQKLKDAGLRVALLDTPILKCVAPGPAPAEHVLDDIKVAQGGFPIPKDEQFSRSMEFLDRAIEAAKIFETSKIRVFSFWRVDEPAEIRSLLVDKLSEAGERAAKDGMSLCIENEGACNIATCEEAMDVLADVPRNVGVIWDVLNGETSGEAAYPDGYGKLDPKRIEHVHLKDYERIEDGNLKVVGIGEGLLPYPDIFRALAADGYQGVISMETHFSVDGSRKEPSRRSMRGILAALEAARG